MKIYDLKKISYQNHKQKFKVMKNRKNVNKNKYFYKLLIQIISKKKLLFDFLFFEMFQSYDLEEIFVTD